MARLGATISAVLLGAVVFSTAVPGTAGATLAFTRNPFHPAVFAAQDNGKGIHRIGAGYAARVSPDGNSIVYYGGKGSEMVIAPAAGGKSRILLGNWREPFTFAFSPDSKLVAALRGHELGKQTLVVIDLATGRQKPIAEGYFDGLSFSPDSSELVFSKSGRAYSSKGDVFRATVAGGKPRAITHDHKSIAPLWGPQGRIVFNKVRNLKSQFGPKADLYLMNPDGSAVKRLTRTKITPLLFGLSAVQWSADGSRLLAEFGGQDTSYAVTVNPRSGAERKVIPGDFEQGFVGTALSGDGKFVLGSTGGAEPGPNHHVAIVPYGGGKTKVLVADGYEPDWNR